MSGLRIREAEEIIADLAARHPQRSAIPGRLLTQLRAVAPQGYLDLLRRVGPCEIAGDFQLLGPAELQSENTLRDVPRVGLGSDWWLFAVSGTGDAWLVRPPDGERSDVAFLDHDEGPEATAKPMQLSFERWLQLADLMAQVEGSDEDVADVSADTHSAVIEELLEMLGAGLSTRFPYDF